MSESEMGKSGMKKDKSVGKENVVRIGVLFTSIVFIAIGIMRQEHLEVLQKAVRICLECIGIG